MMATEQDGDIDSLVSRICPGVDFFERRKFKDKLVEYLTHVSVPAGWETCGYRLSKEHPTYKYHKRLLENFIDKQKLEDEKQKSAGSTVTKTTPEVFFEQLKQFVKVEEQNDSFSEFCDSRRSALIDLFEENLKPHIWCCDTEMYIQCRPLKGVCADKSTLQGSRWPFRID